MATNVKSQWVVIGISGVTCGGKTTLANQLKNVLAPVYVFHQDKYFYPDDSPNHVKCKGLDHNNYDILSSLNMESMLSDINSTLRGVNKSHAFNLEKTVKKVHIEGKKFLIVEGFTVLNYKPIMELCDLCYYLILDYGECYSRRVLRVYDPPDVPGYFEQVAWPEHMRYRQEIENNYPHIKLIDATKYNAFEYVMEDLKRLGATEIKS